MTFYTKVVDDVFIRTDEEHRQLTNAESTLPVGTYVVNFSMIHGYYLSAINDFKRPPKTYGKVESRTERIVETFLSRESGTGVLLCGEQGSGKTMLARELSLTLKEKLGYSTLIVNEPHCGAQFNAFIQNIDTPALVLFDEFEKTYDDNGDSQEKLLTLLDGMYSSKKLFVLTANDSHRINRHLINRPGRIFYNLKYDGLEREFLKEYCDDNLKNTKNTHGVEVIADHFSAFSFDMLKALVEEMNRYDITAIEAVEMLNVKPPVRQQWTFDVEVKIDGKIYENTSGKKWYGNPLMEHIVSIEGDFEWDDDSEPIIPEGITNAVGEYFQFPISSMTGMSGGVFTYKHQNAELKLTREVEKEMGFYRGAF